MSISEITVILQQAPTYLRKLTPYLFLSIMKNQPTIIFHLFSSFFIFLTSLALADDKQQQVYIVHVKQPDIQVSSTQDLESYYNSFLPSNGYDSRPHRRMIYSYGEVFNGFAARLSEEEVEAMKKLDGFLNAHPDRIYELQTTHTPKFLGLEPGKGFWNESNFGRGVIIGVLDTGIWPEHPSFYDHGMPPPPPKWKGICEDMGSEFNASNCNNKLIGARYFINGSVAEVARFPNADTIRDTQGHGTHTASTAAGGFVKHANVFGSAYGTAAGMAPLAHLAIYKVCSGVRCTGSDLLAGLDAAVKDGVDILSLSLSGPSTPFCDDEIAIGAFQAMEKGIFVSCASGNYGPDRSTTTNEAPWMLTVGASTSDRSISVVVKLGNGYSFTGQSLYQPKSFESMFLPLVYLNDNGAHCEDDSLHGIDIEGKIILCLGGGPTPDVLKGRTVLKRGASAMILMNGEEDGFLTFAEAHVLPAAEVSYGDGIKIKSYINSTQKPMASINFKGTVIEPHSIAPVIAPFSSRGPNRQSPGILKPDIVGPGVSILAGWIPYLKFDEFGIKRNGSAFTILSGTSMSTPHLAGIAALLKSSHPHWSPSAIKSAIMTTADIRNGRGTLIVDHFHKPVDLFSIGSGHVNPSRANDPGLIYDVKPDDYILYLCGLGYTDKQVGSIAKGMPIKCSNSTSISEGELNYPSLSVIFHESGEGTQTFTRTVTNVGSSPASYMVEVETPEGTHVRVKPAKLSFARTNDEMSYSITVIRKVRSASEEFSQGYVNWVSLDKKHIVRSPISVTFK